MMKNIEKQKQKGVASLPTILALSALILAIGASVLAITFDETVVSLDQSQTTQALFYAESGAKDALIRIARDKTYNCTTTDCYTIDLATNGCAQNTACAKVSISAGTGASGNPIVIASKGISGNTTRKVQVSVTF